MFKILATHVALNVPDLAAAGRYLEGCGIQKLRELTRPDGLRVVWYPGLELRQAEPNATPGLAGHVAWEVDDIGQAMEALRSAGVTFESASPNLIDPNLLDRPDQVRYAFFATPLGLRGEIVQVTPQATLATTEKDPSS